ncbi:alpha/beta fold hydrolase [Roseivirga sp.]|uniref:alpha/beta fold hydrolase n=1 Tax=Roseivirga sp. TaxID=1964215 RepID=UPI003B8C7293
MKTTLRLTLLMLIAGLIGCSIPKEVLVKEGTLMINGSEVFYKTMGEGEPLIVIHGGPVLDHSYLLPHLEPLAQDYQLIFYDQRASGRSSVEIDSASMSMSGFMEDVELIRKALQLDKINLLAHSWGGLIAMNYAIKYDQNLNHLILSNSIAPNVADWQAENAVVAQNIDPEIQNKLNNIVSSGLLRTEDPREYINEMMTLSYHVQMYDTANLRNLKLYIPQDYMLRNQIFGLLGPDMNNFDLYTQLASVKTPTLVLYGESEGAVDLHAQKMANSFKHGQLSVIEKSGHFPFIESNKTFLAQVEDFLSK